LPVSGVFRSYPVGIHAAESDPLLSFGLIDSCHLLPYLLRPPTLAELPPAFGLACLMAVTFGVTTEAIRRGQLGTVSPIRP